MLRSDEIDGALDPIDRYNMEFVLFMIQEKPKLLNRIFPKERD